MKNAGLNRWTRLIISVLVLMFAGIIYAWSNIKAPLANLGWSGSALTFNYTLTIWFFCIGGLISGFLSKKLSPMVRMILSAVLLFLGFLFTSFLQEGSNILLLYLSYGLMAGTGIGVVYNTVIATVSGWFPDKKGICSGALMMGFGIGAFLIGLVTANIMGKQPDAWRTVYRCLGAITGIVIFLGSFIVKAPKAAPVKANQPIASEGMTSAQMLRRSSFWKLFIFFILFSAVGSSALALAREYTVTLGLLESTAVVFAAVVSVTNSLGRLASGAIVDKWGLTVTKFVTSAVAIVAPLLALAGTLLGSPILGIPGLLLCGFSYGFSPTVSAAFTMEFYGKRDYASNLGIINLVLIPGAFVPTLASGLVSSSGSYVSVFVMLTVFSLVGLVLNLFIKEA